MVENYTLDVQTPFQAALQGYQAGAAIRNDQFQQQQQQAALAQQQQMQRDVGALIQNPNASPRDFAAAMLKYPAMKDQFKQASEMLSTEQKQNFLNHGYQVYAALDSGNPDIARKLLTQRANAMESSGDAAGAQSARAIADAIDVNPEMAKNLVGLKMSGLDERFPQAVATLGDQGRRAALAPVEQRKAEAEAAIKGVEAANAPATAALANANTRSQIEDRAGRLGLDRDKLTSEVQLELHKLGQAQNTLDGEAKKLVNDATVAAVSADQSAGQMLDLADRLQQADPNSFGASTWEGVKKFTGRQDYVTGLRQEYTRLRSTQVSKMLPPGPASDKDIQLALEGFPAPTASTEQVAGFLRGMAKLQQADAAMSSAKAEWVNSVGHLGKPKTDIEIDGIKVPAGTTFPDFSRQFLQRRIDERAAQQSLQTLQGRGYMRYAQPGAAAAAAPAPAAAVPAPTPGALPGGGLLGAD